jgi:hypothetical protein
LSPLLGRNSQLPASPPTKGPHERFRVWDQGIGLRVKGSGVRGLGFKGWGLGFRVWGLGFRV